MNKIRGDEKIKIVEYKDKYAKELSDIILANLYTINIKDYVKEIIIPSSIYACEFYENLGYNFLNNNKKLNEKKQYMMVKHFY